MRMLAIAAVALFAIAAVLWWKTKEQAPVGDGVAIGEPAHPVTSAEPPSAERSAAVEPAAANRPAAPAPSAEATPASCKEYAEKMEKCLASDKFPADAKDMSKQSFESMKSGWAALSAGTGEEQKQAFNSNDLACKGQLDAMKQSGAAMCPGVF